MDKLNFSLVILFCMMTNVLSAQDFEAQNDDGVTFYYNILSDETVEVTYKYYYGYNIRTDEPIVSIPQFVNYDGKTYTVTGIGGGAFGDCRSIEKVIIPNSVTNIGTTAFLNCTSLTSIEIPNSLTTIGSQAFGGCSSLSKIIMDDIDHWFEISFGSNPMDYAHHIYSDEETEITTLVIPNFVTAIEPGAFNGWEGLIKVEIPNTVTDIGDDAFRWCTSLETIKIGNSVTHIGQRAFTGCDNLQKVIVEDIGAWCNITFDYDLYDHYYYDSNPLYKAHHLYSDEDTEITNLIIPGSVTSIAERAFYGCDNIDVVYSLVTKVFTIDEHAFSDIVFNNANLYVPKGKLASYQGTNYWSKFLNIHEGAPTEVGDLDRSYKLKVTDAGMASMYLDYPVVIPDNDNMLGVFYVCSMNDHILNLKRLKETIPANCGVIVMANQGTFTFKETLMSTDVVEENLLTGTTVKVNTADIPGDVYTLGRGVKSGYMGFHKYTGATLPANKAYLVRNADEEEDDVLVIDRSAFDDLFDSTTGVTKIVIDGEDLPIIYDLQGRRVEHPSKGIYIVNGKKKYIK